jgi:hypothetical protein
MLEKLHSRLFDAELLSDMLWKCVLVDNDIEGLVSYECIRSIPYTLVFASLAP